MVLLAALVVGFAVSDRKYFGLCSLFRLFIRELLLVLGEFPMTVWS